MPASRTTTGHDLVTSQEPARDHFSTDAAARKRNLLRAAFAMLHLPMAHLPGETYRWTLADCGSAHSGWSVPHGRPIHL